MKGKISNKVISVIMALLMAVSSFSAPVWAEAPDEELLNEDVIILEEEQTALQEEASAEILDESAGTVDILQEEADAEAEVEEVAEAEELQEDTDETDPAAEEAEEEVLGEDEIIEDDLLTDEEEPDAAGAVDERAEYDFQLEDVERRLPYWNIWINKTANVWVVNDENPDGIDMEYEIYDVIAANSDSSKPAVVVEKQDNGWDLQLTKNPGEAKITQYFYDIHGKKQTHESKIIVLNELWRMDIRTPTGRSAVMLENDQTIIFTNMEHWSFDEEGHHRLSIDGLTYKWSADEDVVKLEPRDDGSVVLTGLKAGMTKVYCEVYYKGTSGDSIKVCEGGTNAYVTDDFGYWYLDPAWVGTWHVGQERIINPRQMHIYKDESGQIVSEAEKEVRFRWEFNPDQLEIKDKNGEILKFNEDGFVYTKGCYGDTVSFGVKRLVNEYIAFRIVAEKKDENGEWQDADNTFYWLDSEEYEFVLIGPGEETGPQTRIFTNQTITLTADTSQLDADGLDYQIEWIFGRNWNDEGEFDDPITGDFYTTSGTHNEKITIYGEKMAGNKRITEEWWVDLLAKAKVGDVTVGRNRGKHIDLSEAREDYDWPFDTEEYMLPEWERWVNDSIHVYIENQEYPDGLDLDLPVTGVTVQNEDPENPALEVTKESGGYRLRSTMNMGTAKVVVSYKDIKGSIQKYTGTFHVGGDAYYAWLDVEDGYRYIHPGETVRVIAGVDHWYYHEGDDEPYGGPEMPSAVYSFEIAEESKDILEIAKQSSDPANVCTIRGKENAIGGGTVIVHVLDGDDNNREVATAQTWVQVRNGFGRIEPARLDSDVKLQTVNPVFYSCYIDDSGKAVKEEVKNVRWRWDYDSNNIVVKDEKGNAVGYNEEGEYLYTDDSYGSGKTFTVERLVQYDTNIGLTVQVKNEGGEWDDAWREDTWLSELDVSFSIVERRPDRWYPVPKNRTFVMHLDTSNRTEGFDYRMEWMAVNYIDDKGNYEEVEDPYFMTVAADGLSASFDGSLMAEHEMLKDRGCVGFIVREYLNDEEVWRQEYGLDFEDPEEPEAAEITKLEDLKDGNLKIYWTDGGLGVDGYQLRWSTDSSFKTGTKTGSYRDVTSTIRKGLEVGKTYYVSIRTFFEADGERTYSAWSKALNVTLAASVKSAEITGLYNSSKGGDLRWKAVSGAEKYVIYRTNGGKTIKIATVGKDQTSYMDTSIKDNCWGKVYVYYVCSQAGKTISSRGEGKTLQRLAPMKITYCKNDKAGSATVKWAVSSGTNKAYGYELQYAQSKEDLFGRTGTFKKVSLKGRNSLSKTISSLKKGKTYYFRVRAYVDYTHSVTKVTTKTWSQYSNVTNVKIQK